MAATKKGEWSMERLIKLTLTDRGHFRVAVKGTFSLCYNTRFSKRVIARLTVTGTRAYVRTLLLSYRLHNKD